MRITELDRDKLIALQTAFDLGYPTRFIRKIILAERPVEINQAMVSARQSGEWESAATVREQLKRDGIKMPTIRTTIGQNFID